MKYRFTYLIFTLLIASCARNSDNKRPQNLLAPDSLWILTGDSHLDFLLQDAITNLPIDSLQRLHDGIMYEYGSTDTEKAKEYCVKLKNLSEYLDWDAGRYLYTSGFSDILISVNMNDSALVFLQQALEFAEKEKNESWKASVFLSMANAYTNKNWNNTALTYMMQALHYFEEINSRYLPYIYCNMGVLYRNINLIETAIEYGKKAIDLNHENPYYLSELGTSYIYQHQYEEGNYYLEEALRHSTANNYIYLSGYIYTYLGNNALLNFDLDKAEMYARKAMDIFQGSANLSNYCANYLLLGKVELSRGHFEKSEEYIKQALKIASDVDDLSLTKTCYIILSELSVVQNKFRDNIQYRSKWESIENIMETKTAVIAAAEMSAKYEISKKELQIERQKTVIARQNMQYWLLIAAIAVSIVFLLLLWRILFLRNRRNRALSELNKALAESNSTKDKFFSIISHDLKNPAISQRDALRRLVRNGRIWDADMLSDYYNELLQSSETEVQLIYNLLDWSRIQTNRITCTPRPFNLELTLRTDISMARSIAEKKGIALISEIPADIQITGDANMLSTIVRNLLSNAIKFTSTGSVSLSVEPSEGKHIIAICDTGTGMNQEQLQQILRLHSNYSQPGTACEHGTGLGLLVCREFLEKHGSELHVESEVGKGSKFWFEISK